MNFVLLLTTCLAYALDQGEKPSFPHRVGQAVEVGLGKTWNATKFVAAKVSRGAKITTHKALTALGESSEYLDKKVVASIKPEQPARN